MFIIIEYLLQNYLNLIFGYDCVAKINIITAKLSS